MIGVPTKIAAATLGGGLLAVLAVPALIDWSPLRPGIERAATSLLGWPVTVAGPVSVRLLPAPAVTLHQMSVGTTGYERARLGLALWPLLSGRIAIDRIDLTDGRLGGGLGLSARIDLDRGFTASGHLRVAGTEIPFDAEGGRPGGSAVVPVRAVPVRAVLHLPSPAGGTVRFDGNVAPGLAEGRLTMALPSLTRATGSGELPDVPVSAEARLAITVSEMAMQDLEILIGESRIAGEAVADLKSVPAAVDISLRAATLDLDPSPPPTPAEASPPAAATPSPPPPAASPPAPAPTPLRLALPANITVNLDVGIDAVRWRGDLLRRVRLNALLDEGRLTVSRASAHLPGATTFDLSGIVATEGAEPTFTGGIRLDSADPPRFFAWVRPGGTSGRWPVHARLDATLATEGRRIRLAPLALALDDLKITGQATLGPQISLRLSGRGIEASADGQREETGRLVGTIGLRGPSFAEAIRLIAPDYRPGRDGAFVLAARLDREDGAVTLDDLTLTAAATTLGGRVRIESGRPVLADLRAETLTLDAFLPAESHRPLPRGTASAPARARQGRDEAPPPPAVPRGRVEAAQLRPSAAPAAEIDLSVAALSVQGWRLTNLTTRLILDGESTRFESLRAGMLGGHLEGDGRFTPAGISATLAVGDIEIGGLGLSGGGLSLTGGRLTGQARFSAARLSGPVLARTLGGEASWTVVDGTIAGVDLATTNDRLGRGGGLAALVAAGGPGGTTRFSRLSGTLRGADGILDARDLRLSAEGGTVSGTARLDLRTREIDSRLSLALASGQPAVTMRAQGGLDAPNVTIDANALQKAGTIPRR